MNQMSHHNDSSRPPPGEWMWRKGHQLDVLTPVNKRRYISLM